MATDTPLPSDLHVESRDFRIQSITLVDAAGAYTDITNLTMEAQLRQDMYLGIMNGELLVTDGVDLFSQYSLHGGEYLYIHLTEPEQKLPIRKAFRIYKIGERRQLPNGTQRYSIYFMSDELFQSYTMKISKAYTNTTVSDIVSDIMRNWLNIPDSRIRIDQTSNPIDIIIPSYRPTEALNWLATRAFKGEDACWFFYENLDGFNFRSLSSIYRSGTVVKVPFVLENMRVNANPQMNKYSIEDIESKRDFDVLSTISTGGYAMHMQGIDPLTRQYYSNDYSVDKLTKLFPNPSMSGAGSLFTKYDSHQMVYLQMDALGSMKKNHSEVWVKRAMSLSALNNTLITVTVPGNVRLQIGTLINIRIPYSITPNEGDMWDRRKSGRYLIVAVNHKFNMINHKFDSILLLSRDSATEPLSYDNTLPEKIRRVNESQTS